MPVLRNEYNAAAKGGTELSIEELERYVGADLDQVNIIPGRFRGLPESKLPLIFWVHDTHDDPEMRFMHDGGWQAFDVLVFVSYWQRQKFMDHFGIPYSKTRVIHNAISVEDEPVIDLPVGDGPVRFIYHTTPHRGLQVLVPAFIKAAEREHIHLDVYSSFSMYGRPDGDAPYKPLFGQIESRPDIMTNHGAVPNDQVRAALKRSHSFVYPCIWPETGCRSLIEAMAEGLICSTSDYAALTETAFFNAHHFPMHENPNVLAGFAAEVIANVAHQIRNHPDMIKMRRSIANNARHTYDWRKRALDWKSLIGELAS